MYNKKMPIDLSCGMKVALEVIGGKWKSYIILAITEGSKRPSEIHKRIPETSPRVIDQQIKELLDYGVLSRTVFNTISKHTEYDLTDFGKTLLPVINSLKEWGDKYTSKIKEAIQNKNNL
mgnify:CR=1 FL=1